MRVRAKMTQAELAFAVSVAQPSISDYETGNKNPSLKTLCKLARALGCTVDELIGGDGDEKESAE